MVAHDIPGVAHRGILPTSNRALHHRNVPCVRHAAARVQSAVPDAVQAGERRTEHAAVAGRQWLRTPPVHSWYPELITGRRRCQFRGMEDLRNERLTDAEMHELFDRPFPQGFAGADVVSDIAPECREQSPLLACFRAEIDQMNARAREEALDRPSPATVRAYREMSGRDPCGWPPA